MCIYGRLIKFVSRIPIQLAEYPPSSVIQCIRNRTQNRCLWSDLLYSKAKLTFVNGQDMPNKCNFCWCDNIFLEMHSCNLYWIDFSVQMKMCLMSKTLKVKKAITFFWRLVKTSIIYDSLRPLKFVDTKYIMSNSISLLI